MSDAPSAGNPWEPLLLLVAFIAILIAIIWVRGGLSQLNTEGFFINPANPPPTNQPAPQQVTSDNATT